MTSHKKHKKALLKNDLLYKELFNETIFLQVTRQRFVVSLLIIQRTFTILNASRERFCDRLMCSKKR